MRTNFISVLAALAFAGATAPAFASETVAISVDYSDLDLADSAAMAELQDRVAKAAREACGRPQNHAAKSIAATQACRAALIAGANAQLAAIGATAGETFAAR